MYYALRKLQRDGVIVKLHDRFSISLSWAFEVVRFADELFEKQIVAAPVERLLPAANKKQVWTFTNLLKLDDFWVQLMFVLYQRTKKGIMFSWCPHPWFYFAQADKLGIFHSALRAEKREVWVVIGGQTFLDRTYSSLLIPDVHRIAFTQKPFEKRWRTHFCTIGDYIITVTIPASIMREIDTFFESVSSGEQSNYAKITGILLKKSHAKIEIANVPEKARKLQHKLARYFKPKTHGGGPSSSKSPGMSGYSGH